MKYQEYKQADWVRTGEDILKFWKEQNIFQQSVSSREGCPSFTFYEGPPSANGMPGIHHVMARTIKDIFCRYKTLKGFQVKRKGGWDTHGLPVELKVEKDLGITKEDIGVSISIEEYNQKCREAVMKFTSVWDDLTEKMGYWVDLENPYITYENPYIESLWNLLKRLYDKNLLYKGYTIQPYSPAAGTGLSSHELNLPGCYKEVKDTSVVAMFKVAEGQTLPPALAAIQNPPLYILAWTTTPWTLPANTGLAVGADITYVLVETFNPYTHERMVAVLAKELLHRYFDPKHAADPLESYQPGAKHIPYSVRGELTGSELTGIRYEQLLPFVQPEGDAFRVIPGDFVSTEDGTGIVHISPTFGADDARVAKQHNIPPMLVKDAQGQWQPLVNRHGQFVEQVKQHFDAAFPEIFGHDRLRPDFIKPEYEPEGRSEQPNYIPSDVLIATYLKTQNKAFRVEKYEHTYPHCWRTDKPILYYPMDSWFIRTTAMKDKMVELNKTINWKPRSTGEGRFGNWLENLVDWNLSRSRYWGCPLPVWRAEDGSEEICIGSIADLQQAIAHTDPALIGQQSHQDNQAFLQAVADGSYDLHRPYIDRVVLSKNGKVLRRESDLIDVWFDSGAMPFAQWHYPFENQDIFKAAYPADFISEGVDQTRGWFFTLHAISAMLEESVAFRNVVSTGLVLDANGNKMSKRLGNVIDPFQTIGTYGPDATRWYMITNANPWENLRFSLDGITEVQRKFFGTLYNTYSFFALYSNLDGFRYQEAEVPLATRPESDQWILSRLHSLIQTVDEAYADYEPTKAGRAIQDFTCDDLSNWYVRLNRKRFWKGEYNQDKLAAYQTLYTCLVTVAKLMSPIAPFYAEQLYADLNRVSGKEPHQSVHLAFMPAPDPTAIQPALEERMGLAQNISSMVHSIRKHVKIKVRQPLTRVLIPDLNERLTAQIRAVEELIKAEVNIKHIEYVNDEQVVVKKVKPNFAVLGKKGLGKLMKEVQNALGQLDQQAIRTLEKGESLSIPTSEQPVSITAEDVLIESADMPGWATARDGGLTVALDIHLSEELRQEGIARDVVNRIQNLRKDQGMEVQDKIRIRAQASEAMVDQALAAFREYICAETQALSLEVVPHLAESTLLDLDDFQLHVSVEIA